ncbi:hypothetical protein AUEXF2481DRAFT_33946 [Aureobasidium subglaciale EXF-2481]|uniref:Uncharacterized protein n=1 Tax=Aureobasidium subglaciale (strain EXF-2481) TaxID=1043005 RepID=A0A074XYG4_AURSE|nr:uncharacterized protein AUEXF2481DRAFT_33946 [Aureobasidium subglaciale EXF-2481]KEQ90515.1 hypothetical protein AUEXF2481DRAFT_33946 [Aureobasidium subglaciale EXF-2481]
MDSPHEEVDLPLLPYEPTDDKHHYESEILFSGTDKHIDNALGKSVTAITIRRRKKLYTILLTNCITCLATISVIAATWVMMSERSRWTISSSTTFVYDEVYSIDSPQARGCGSTVEEATALGCRFDELSDLWLPKACSRKYEEEYLRSNNGGAFVYWSDPSGDHVITNRSQYAGVATYFSTTRDHLRHCEYNLYRFADSLTTGDLVGHAEGFGPHMHHCANVLGKFANLAPDIDNIDVDTESTFGFC